MDSFDKKIKQLLQNDQEHIPPMLDWEEMESGIMDRMPKKKNRKYLWLLLLSFPIAALVLAKFITKAQDNVIVISDKTTLISDQSLPNAPLNEEPNTLVSEEFENDLSSGDSFINSKNVTSDNSKLSSSSPSNTDESLFSTQNNKSSKIESSSKEAKQLITTTRNPQLTIKTNRNISKNELSPIPNVTYEENTGSSSKMTISDPYENNKIIQNTLISTSFISALDSRPLKVADINLPFYLELINTQSENGLLDSKNKLTSKISIEGGYTSWAFNTSNKSKFNIEPYESPLASWNTGLHYSIQKNDKWMFETGVNFSQLASKFEHVFVASYEAPTDSVPVTNSLTGAIRFEDGTKLVTDTRFIRHYNYMNIVEIPLEITRIIPLNQTWSLNLSAGAQIGLVNLIYGKSIDVELEYIEYPETKNHKFLGFCSLLSAASLNYTWNKSTSVYAKSSFVYGINNWMNSNVDIRQPYRLNLNLGVRKNF